MDGNNTRKSILMDMNFIVSVKIVKPSKFLSMQYNLITQTINFT